MSGGRAGCGQIIVLPRIVVEYEVGRSGVGLWGAEGGQWRTQNEGGGSNVVLAKRLLLREWEGSGRLVLSIVDGRSERAACLTTEDPPPRPPNGKGKATQGATAARRSAPKRALCQPPAIPTGLTLKERGQLAQEQPLDFFSARPCIAASSLRQRGHSICRLGCTCVRASPLSSTAASLPLLRWRDP